jgi:SAM-dependent methyltransferase
MNFAPKSERINYLMPDGSYEGKCCVCGNEAVFLIDDRPVREGFCCSKCNASARYRCQAQAILSTILSDATSIADFSESSEAADLSIFEPGVIGPYRKYLKKLRRYQNSFFTPEFKLGQIIEGVRNENLEKLTFADNSFDLVITSDIFEHIRRPFVAFGEVNRILKPGGAHIFTVPMLLPLPARTRVRVDTRGDEDVHLHPPHYHGDGKGGESLVYNDFGEDMIDRLRQMTGASVSVHPHVPESSSLPEALKRVVCFIAVKQ